MPSQKLAYKYLLALESAIEAKPESGLNGFEQKFFCIHHTVARANTLTQAQDGKPEGSH